MAILLGVAILFVVAFSAVHSAAETQNAALIQRGHEQDQALPRLT